MEWKQQFEIIHKIISQKIIANNEKPSLTNISQYLRIPLHKYQAWQRGQKPVRDDLILLAQEHDFNADWLLLGIGEPIQKPLDGPLNPENVDICDTLHDLISQLPDKLPKIAEIGGITPADLYNIIHTQALPPTQAIAKWVIHYHINANFLLAQIGQPFLTEEQYNETGKLEYVRWRRGDFIELDKEDKGSKLFQKEIARLKQELEKARISLQEVSNNLVETNQERRSLQDKLNNQEEENRKLQAKLTKLENENMALKTELDNFKKQAQSKVAEQE